MDIEVLYILLPLLIGYFADSVFGDPAWLPHPVIGFGLLISKGEKILNNGKHRLLKGAVLAVSLILLSFGSMYWLLKAMSYIHPSLYVLVSSIVVFYCLAGKTLIEEVKQVFIAVDKSVDDGRRQVARIVGRDTSTLSPQQIRTAALETLSENLSDGVIAPLFWFMVLGVPGMFAYKMVNTLDSMLGYKNTKYKDFGCWSARIDDICNYIPARLTAFLMVVVSGKYSLFAFILKYGIKHASPNSGYPESALAGILDCRFGGPNIYFGKIVDKPYIGDNDKELTTDDMKIAISINRRSEVVMVLLVGCISLIYFLYK